MYDFSTNPIKLQRAIVLAGPEGDVKAEYIKLGGLLASGHKVDAPVVEEVEAPKEKKTKKK